MARNEIEGDLAVVVLIRFLQEPSLDQLWPVVLEAFQTRAAALQQQDEEAMEKRTL
jgi:hypothetical protein